MEFKEPKFKVGDKVVLISESKFNSDIKVGSLGNIMSIGFYGCGTARYTIDNIENHNYTQYATEEDLEYPKIKNTKIARKLNPNHKVEGDWIIPRGDNK